MKLRKAIESRPGQAAPHNSLGELLLEAGKLDEAAAEFRAAAEAEPASAAARVNLARTLARQGKFDEATLQVRRVLLADARYAPAYYQLGAILDARGEPGEAMVQWRKALQFDTNYAEAHAALGRALYAKGQTAEALRHWRESLKLRPNDAPVLRQAAWALATSPDPAVRNGSEAMALAVRAVQTAPGNDPVVLDALAAAYAENARFADAALTARRAQGLAVDRKQEALAAAIAGRVALYEAEKPYRAPVAAGTGR
jgi:tetratricopeptide (TPR) repeat protein